MKLTIGNFLEQSQSMNQQETNICGIRFYLIIERFTIQILLHNQLLIILEQGTKQYTISNQTYEQKYYDIIQKHNASVIEELNRLCHQWSKQIVWNLTQWIRSIFDENLLRSILAINLSIIQLITSNIEK